MLRTNKEDTGRLFDIAKIESTNLEGEKKKKKKNNIKYEAMNPQYTTDGGHLNNVGQKIVAKHLLIFLSKLK